ncbi:MAG: TMEM165/GDT1 family protein [Burkholderiaceae bacterium]
MAWEALTTATVSVAIGEIGDKTQLLTLVLAARFPRALPIIAGIVVATLANHALAVALGVYGAQWLTPENLRWVLGLSFLGLAAWALIPDRLDADEVKLWETAFIATVIAFFIAEIGDKTQVATALLGAKFSDAPVQVVLGSTIGMVMANAPAIWLGERLLKRVPMRLVRWGAAGLFAAFGFVLLVVGLPAV